MAISQFRLRCNLGAMLHGSEQGENGGGGPEEGVPGRPGSRLRRPGVRRARGAVTEAT